MLIFTGDINLTDWNFSIGFGTGTKIANGLDPFMYLNRNAGDTWIGNFEGVCASNSDYPGAYGKAFRILPDDLRKIKQFNIYGFANNHAMEHGAKAYHETVSNLESMGCEIFGTKEKHTITKKYKEQQISITGICFRVEALNQDPEYWHNPEYKEIDDEIQRLPKDSYKVLFLHWGNEFINRPSAPQKKFAHWLIDIGFNLIIGMHPHVLQGYEEYNGGRIYYSLGNLVFEMPSEQCKIGAIVGLDFINNKPKFSERYIIIDAEGCPHYADENKIPEYWRFDFLNKRLSINDNTEEYHSEIHKGYLTYRKANRLMILKSAVFHPLSFWFVLKDFVKRRL